MPEIQNCYQKAVYLIQDTCEGVDGTTFKKVFTQMEG